MTGDLRIELLCPEDDNNLDIFATLSGRRIPLWLIDDAPVEILVTRVHGDGGAPQRITVEAYCDQRLDELPEATELAFLGWRVQSITEQVT